MYMHTVDQHDIQHPSKSWLIDHSLKPQAPDASDPGPFELPDLLEQSPASCG